MTAPFPLGRRLTFRRRAASACDTPHVARRARAPCQRGSLDRPSRSVRFRRMTKLGAVFLALVACSSPPKPQPTTPAADPPAPEPAKPEPVADAKPAPVEDP